MDDLHDTATTWRDYDVVGKLAEGGMAEVYLARAKRDRGGAFVVIKRPLPDYANRPMFRTMFVDEILMSSRMRHPNIVETVGFDVDAEPPFMVLEYVDGCSLLELMKARETPLPVPLALRVTHELLEALAFAHTATDVAGEPLRLVHRDVSLGNLLLARDGQVKLADFGVARAVYRLQATTQRGVTKGKVHYMSPEQLRTSPDIDARADLYSAGIVLAEVLMRRQLFKAPSHFDLLSMVNRADISRLEQFGKSLPGEILTVLRRALRRDPDERYQTAAEFQQALRDVGGAALADVGKDDVAACVAEVESVRNSAPAAASSVGAAQAPSELVSGDGTPGQPVASGEDSSINVSDSDSLVDVYEVELISAVADSDLLTIRYELAVELTNGAARGHLAATVESEDAGTRASPAAPDDPTLARVLGELGWITEAQRDLAIETARDFSESMADALVRLGLVEPHAGLARLVAEAPEELCPSSPDEASAEVEDAGSALPTLPSSITLFEFRPMADDEGIVFAWNHRFDPARGDVRIGRGLTLATELGDGPLARVLSALFPRARLDAIG